MVNVGGRSKGCSTCRRRRIKCDETKPICNRCLRCGLDCDGPRSPAFITSKIVQSRRKTDKRTSPPPIKQPKDPLHEEPPTPRILIKRSPPLTPPLQPDPFIQSICYSRTHLRRGAAIDIALENTQLTDLILAGTTPLPSPSPSRSASPSLSPSPCRGAPPPPPASTLFPRTLLTFATILYATHHADAPLLQTGYTLHAQSLTQLNALLCLPSTHTSDTLLLAIATLAILEYLVPTTSTSASTSTPESTSARTSARARTHLAHMLGINHLLSLRDPRQHTSPLSIALYKSVRHMCVFASLNARRGAVFAREEWRGVMRDACGSEEERREEEVWDVLGGCSVLVEESDKLFAVEEFEREKEKEKIVGQAEELWDRLCVWGMRWGGGGKEDGQSARCSTSLPTMMLYHTAAIHVLRLRASLALASSAPHTSALPCDDHTQVEYLTAERTAALCIRDALPYYVASAPAHMVPVVHWALITASETLGEEWSGIGGMRMGRMEKPGVVLRLRQD